jgi:two-component system, response regulator PdtaR
MSGELLPSRPSAVVLVVEDDVLLRLVTASNLRHVGFEVFEAADAAEAVTILNTFAVDALLSDVVMPGKMDGVALAKWVRERELRTRIILTSGTEPSLGEVEKYACFLAKPYDDSDVQQLLTTMLSH